MTMTKEQRALALQKAQEARQANKAEQQATLETLEGGAKVYRDSPPGIGFVLEFPNGRKCYYATSSIARSMWVDRWRVDYDNGNWGKLKEAVAA